MDKIKLEDLKGSEKLKIEAAVLEIMEAKGFTLDKEFGIIESLEDSNCWIMAFKNKVSDFEDLANITLKLGNKFRVQITSKSKENILFRIEAPGEEFVILGHDLKPLTRNNTYVGEYISASTQIPSRPEFDKYTVVIPIYSGS